MLCQPDSPKKERLPFADNKSAYVQFAKNGGLPNFHGALMRDRSCLPYDFNMARAYLLQKSVAPSKASNYWPTSYSTTDGVTARDSYFLLPAPPVNSDVSARHSPKYMDIQIVLLADHQEFIPTIASWLHSEWGHLRNDSSSIELSKNIQNKVNRTKPPIHIIALIHNNPVGVAVLKKYEMEQYPEKEDWLGSLYVKPDYRKNKIGQHLINKIIDIAEDLSINKLYLQTERLDGGLYQALGWYPIEIAINHGDQILIMERFI